MKVLVCEDDEIVIKVIQVALEEFKAEAIYAKDGIKALKLLKDGVFDVIITDIHMPYHNGDEILKFVREVQNKRTPIIMISSDTEEEVIALALKQGVNEFVKKPLDPKLLNKALRKFIKI